MTDTPRALASQEASRPDPALGHPAAPGSLSAQARPLGKKRALSGGSELPAMPLSQTYVLRDLKALDNVTLHITDFAPGQGKLTIECYGCAWSCWWGSMGADSTVLQFVATADAGYIANCLIRGRRNFITSRKGERQEMEYLTRICEALIEFSRAAIDRATGAKP